LETALGVIRAAAHLSAPVIVQISEATVKYAGLDAITAIIETVGSRSGNFKIALHLDHGKDWEIVKECIAIGFSSVHRDASDKPFAENVKLTKQAVVYGHNRGVWVQGELGALVGKEGMTKISAVDREASFTDPVLAKEFVAKTGVDTLAISVGTMHGSFIGQEKIEFPILTAIRKNVINTPLVLHGASGTPADQLKKAVKSGVTIINIDTDLRLAFTKKLQETVKAISSVYDPRKILGPSIDAVQSAAEEKIKLFGAISKA
jgi:fructose-bisphosphate aldolase class II